MKKIFLMMTIISATLISTSKINNNLPESKSNKEVTVESNTDKNTIHDIEWLEEYMINGEEVSTNSLINDSDNQNDYDMNTEDEDMLISALEHAMYSNFDQTKISNNPSFEEISEAFIKNGDDRVLDFIETSLNDQELQERTDDVTTDEIELFGGSNKVVTRSKKVWFTTVYTGVDVMLSHNTLGNLMDLGIFTNTSSSAIAAALYKVGVYITTYAFAVIGVIIASIGTLLYWISNGRGVTIRTYRITTVWTRAFIGPTIAFRQ